MSIIRLLETGIYLAVGRHFPTNYTGVAPEDILALDAPIRREESVAIADRLRARFLNPPQTIVCAPARRARETVEML